MQAFAQSIVDTVRHPLLVLDGRLCVVAANPSFYRTFGTTSAATERHDFFEIDGGRWDQPRLRTLLREVIPRDRSFKDVEFEYDCPHLGRRVMVLDAHRVSRDDGTPMVLLAMEDDTERRRVRNELRRLNVELENRAVDRTAELMLANQASWTRIGNSARRTGNSKRSAIRSATTFEVRSGRWTVSARSCSRSMPSRWTTRASTTSGACARGRSGWAS